MKAVIVLVMHGVPPNDFSRQDMVDFFSLQARLMTAREDRAPMQRRYAELESKMRAWPRTAQNDPFYAGSHALAWRLSQVTGWGVIVAFNQFCAPSIDDALDQAAAQGAERIIVITPMMTQGGEHSEMDIPVAIHSAQERHPEIPILYVWPFDVGEVAQFLADQIYRFMQKEGDSAEQTD